MKRLEITDWLEGIGLSVAEYRLYCRLCYEAGDSNECQPKTSRLAEATGLAAETVKLAMRGLIDRGLVKPNGCTCRMVKNPPSDTVGQAECYTPAEDQWRGVLPKGAKQMSLTRRKRARVNNNPPILLRLMKLFVDNPTRLATVEEAVALQEIAPAEEELEAIERLYASNYEYKRRNLITLLNNWHTELDKAEQHAPKPKRTRKINLFD